jgi:hypothetical protein
MVRIDACSLAGLAWQREAAAISLFAAAGAIDTMSRRRCLGQGQESDLNAIDGDVRARLDKRFARRATDEHIQAFIPCPRERPADRDTGS